MLLFFGKVVATTLLIQVNSLSSLFDFLLQNLITVGFRKWLTIFRVFAVGTSDFEVVNGSQGHTQGIEAKLIACSLGVLNIFTQALLYGKFLTLCSHSHLLLPVVIFDGIQYTT